MTDTKNRNGAMETELAVTDPSQNKPIVAKSYIESLTLSNKATLIAPEELAKRAKKNSRAEKKRITNALDNMLDHYKDALS